MRLSAIRVVILSLLVISAVGIAGSSLSALVYDRDCSDFATYESAQLFYHLTGGPILDFHNLDGDNNGEACEDNVRRSPINQDLLNILKSFTEDESDIASILEDFTRVAGAE